MKLSEQEQAEVKQLHSKLHNLYEEKARLEVMKKDRENTLKDDIAAVCDIVNGDGIPQGAKVKMPLVQAVINQLFRQKPNKKDEEHDTLEIYRSAIKKEQVSKELVNDYIVAEDLLVENKQNIKEAFKETSVLSKEILNAIDMIVKEKYKEMKEDALEKAGYEVSVARDKSEIYDIKESLEKFLNDGE